MFSVIMPLCNRILCCIFGWYFYVKSGWNIQKNILLSSSRASSLSHSTISLSTPVNNSQDTWKKKYKMQQNTILIMNGLYIFEKNIIYCKIGCSIQSAETHVDKKMQSSLSTQKKKGFQKSHWRSQIQGQGTNKCVDPDEGWHRPCPPLFWMKNYKRLGLW